MNAPIHCQTDRFQIQNKERKNSMRIIQISIVIGISFAASQGHSQSFFGNSGAGGDQTWEPEAGLVRYYQDLKPTSLEILQKAVDKTHSETYEQMYQALSSAEIVIGDPGLCTGGATAYSYPVSSTIFVCNEYGEDYGIRTLIHESVHLTGDMDECEADRLSGMAEIESGEGLSAPGSYDNQCPDNPRY
jgi:hypothetical protein